MRKIPNLNKNLFDELLVANDKLRMSKIEEPVNENVILIIILIKIAIWI